MDTRACAATVRSVKCCRPDVTHVWWRCVNRYLFSNCHSVLIVAGRLVFGMPVNPLEVVGAAVAVAGGVVVSMDHTDSTAHGQGPTTYGDLLACVSCLGGLVFVLMAKTGQQKLGVVPFTAIMQVRCTHTVVASAACDPGVCATAWPHSRPRLLPSSLRRAWRTLWRRRSCTLWTTTLASLAFSTPIVTDCR